jgi:hypothetical protein
VRDHNHKIGRLAVGNKGLLAVDDVGIALLLRRRLDALQVGASAGLGHGNGADHFARGHLRQPTLLLFLGAVVEDVVRDDSAVHGDAGGDLRHHAFDVLQHRGVIGKGRAQPAIFFRHACQERPHLAQPPPSGAVDHLLAAPFLGMRRQVLGEEFAELVAKRVQFLGHPRRAILHRKPRFR